MSAVSWAQQPLLVPSVASAVLVQTLTPEAKSGRIRPTGIGQLTGLGSGLIGVVLAHASSAPIFMGGHPLIVARLVAAFVAVLVTGCLQSAFMAISPAGGATALIVALGMETPDWSDMIAARARAGDARLALGLPSGDAIVTNRRLAEIVRRQQHAALPMTATVQEAGRVVRERRVGGIVSMGDFKGLERARLDEETGFWEIL